MKCCCNETLNLGCYDHTKIVTFPMENLIDEYKIRLNFNGSYFFYDLILESGQVSLSLPLINPNYTFDECVVYDSDDNVITYTDELGTVYDCFSFSVVPKMN